ncbi:hypothetical protein NA57DRAFT_68745 [Rhizodiscina lignyota]|uniref:RNA polymerase II subunit B1 CTD phosphatase RPAP2 homolog n=1 Tax=Rhizodiscina lignyota TaxID=1504668 RepID=A0A9P4I7K6_9PEZI|nr:hypothetical protein NA57DRAFT_68745 [Rhizodiscina lignyota]
MGPKSILKTTKQPSDEEAQTKEERNREIAVHHASLIQQQKDVENQIFESLLRLIDLPSNADSDPAHPSSDDVATLKNDLNLFQQSDFDALVEERHANGTCGYALCPRPHQKESSTGKFRIIKKHSASEMKIVPRESLENWCSDACGSRAMYLKVQLSDEPAWLRSTGPVDLTLFNEDEGTAKMQSLPLRLKPDHADEMSSKLQQGMTELRLERGDTQTSSRPGNVLSSTIFEKDKIRPPIEPEANASNAHDLVEGFRPKSKLRNTQNADSDEEGDHDWGI